MRGTYHYALDGKPDVVLEEWSRRASGGGVVTRVTRRSETFGALIEVEVAEQPDLIEATFDWRNSSPKAVPVARATYRLQGGQLSVTRSLPADDSLILGSVIGGDPVLRPNLDFPTQTYPIPPNAIFFPLMRIFTGKVIKHVAQTDGATVIVPNIKDPTQPHELLTPIFEQRTAKRIGSETLTLYKRSIPTQVYQYIGGNYDDEARFWLDSNDILIRYSFQNWDVTLERG